MQNKHLLFFGLAASLFLLAYSASPPNRHTGAPGEDLCTDCHSLNGGTQDGNIVVTGFPSVIIPNQSYVLTITSNNPNGVASKAGFELVILNSDNNNAGDLINPGTFSHLQSEAGREYWKHNPAQNYPVSNSISWTVTWVAPITDDDVITYYAAGNIANGNNNTTGDLIVTTSGSGNLVGVDPLNITVTGTNVDCNGDATGTATATVSGGEPPYNYQWSNGDSESSISNLSAGVYTLTVTDNIGLTATSDVEISEPPVLNLSNATVINESCSGRNDGSITLTGGGAVGGTPGYSFSWSNGETGTTIDELSPGTYAVTVTDDNDCTSSESFVVGTLDALDIANAEISHESCSGENDGSIAIEVTGGEAPYFAEWSNGSIGSMINGLEPGDYTVTVTDANGCNTEATFVINEGSIVNADGIITPVSCFGGNDGEIELTELTGNGPFTFDWSHGDIGEHIINLEAGNYLVTITDSEGCSAVKVYIVPGPAPFEVVLSLSGDILCAGNQTVDISTAITGGEGPFTYLWSNDATTPNLNDVGAGEYSVTVTSASLCTTVGSVTISEPAPLQVSVNTEDVSEQGANDGEAYANVNGGVGVLLYFWNTGAITDTIKDLAPGVYSVTVTDENGCTGVGSGQVDDFGCTLEVSLGEDVGICGGNFALLDATVTGAEGNISYLWSTGSTDASIVVDQAGEYCVTVTDEEGCVDSDCIIVDVSIVPDITCEITAVTHPNASDGAIGCGLVPGVASYLWSTGEVTPSISNLSIGEYCVTLTNELGCQAIQCFVVELFDCPGELVIAGSSDVCLGDESGSLTVFAVNIPEPFTYNWSNGGDDETISNLGVGTYTVTVTDANGCISVISATIDTLPSPVIILDSIFHIQGGLENGGIYITINSLFGTVVQWTTPSGNTLFTEDIINLSEPGEYHLLVTDFALCTAQDSFTIELINGISDIRPKQVKVYPTPAEDWVQIEMETSALKVFVSGIDGRLVREFNSPSANRIQVKDLQPGIYFLQIFDGSSWYSAKILR